ncbi:MAG: packaged DNA stabilization protein [Glaciecola sp.]
MIPLIKGQRKTNYDYRDNLPVNMTAVAGQVEGDTGYLLAHDGLTEFAQTSGVARGGYFNERLNQHYRVSGNELESVSASGEVEQLGNIAGQGTVSFAESFNSLGIVAGGKFYLYDAAGLEEVTDSDLGIPIDVTWFRGIYVLTDGEYLYSTSLSDETEIRQLDFVSSEFSADPVKGLLRTDSNQIVAFNRYSTEYFYFDANSNVNASPLRVIDGKSNRIGIIGTHCKAFLDGNIFILGGRKDESPSIHALSAGTEVTIATREIDKIIATYTEAELSGAVLEDRTVDRDKFLIVHLPNHTLLYNHTIGQSMGTSAAWTYLKSDEDSKWRGKYGVFDPRISKWVYGDTKENKLACLDDKSFAQYGVEQEALIYTPIIPAKRISINQVQIDTLPGYSDPARSVAMSISYDAITWGEEHWTVTSKPDNYNTNYIVRRLGFVPQSFSLRFRFISKDKMAFSGLTINDR